MRGLALKTWREGHMALDVLHELLDQEPRYQRLLASLRRERPRVDLQLLSNAVPFVLSSLSRGLGYPMVVVAPKPEEARRLYEQMTVWADGDTAVLHFPETEALPFERVMSDDDTVHQRIGTLARLSGGGPGVVVVASVTALVQSTVDRALFESSRHTLIQGQTIDPSSLRDLWHRMGYRFEPNVDAPGVASRRGGILDIFPPDMEAPARIELWGNEIDSIRVFDPSSQRSSSRIESLTVIPCKETLPGLVPEPELEEIARTLDLSPCGAAASQRISDELALLLEGQLVEDIAFYAGLFNHGSLLQYLPDDSLLVMHRPVDIAEAGVGLDERTQQLRRTKERRGELPADFPSPNMTWEEVRRQCGSVSRRLEVSPWGAVDITHHDAHSLPFASPPGFFGKPEAFVEAAARMAGEGHRVLAVTTVPKRLAEILGGHGVEARVSGTLDGPPAPGAVTVVQAEGAGLDEGVVLAADSRELAVFSDAEIFGVAKRRRSVRRKAARRDSLLSELSPGDFVVHVEHGIGKFTGTGSPEWGDGDREYLILQYADGDRLYVPMDHLDRVTPYVAPLDRAPALTRLGSQEWSRTKARVERSTREMASELLSLYAARELTEGQASAADTPWQAELEASFPFEETPDQVAAIGDVKSDMEGSKPMDRLVCGDVGYGKTEVALRAAFKTVMGGKQVAVLVPTTVLAQQHHVTFSQRLAAYPVKVDVLSRFRSHGEQRAIVNGLADGTIDICVGTHRLIQKDVGFKDLGLVIIDEEQRFGVGHKERLKQMRHEVDVLTMTATPIPRTLHLSLAGLRDMSTIETPPEERLPIKTYVSEFSDELIREAIRREIDRQGQVFFLHNRVYNIDYMAGYVRALAPEAEVGVAHGQMPEDQLERAMVDFSEGRTDVLVCTTIIESGLDIPNVNTLIVNRADSFGLSQLYQLRGRVGRGARRAYSYLLIPPAKSLTETAEKRLKTMLAATELGAGFRIAMTDLEIRGAGSILGAHQSGHIHAVGFDLYSRLLGEAVEALRAQREFVEAGDVSAAEPAPKLAPASVDLGIPANIPESYVADLATRIGVYRRLVGLGDAAASQAIEDELRDRFGPLPWQVQNLIYVARLRAAGAGAGVRSITKNGERIVLQLHDEIGGARRALQRKLERGVEAGHSQVRLDLEALSEGWQGPLMRTVEALSDFRTRVVALAAVAGH